MDNKHYETGQLSISSLNSLTRTEWRVLLFIARDLPNRNIAQILSIEIKSVHNYRTRIGDKLNIKGCFVLGSLARHHCSELQNLYHDWYGADPLFN